jgi:hypothetical protein
VLKLNLAQKKAIKAVGFAHLCGTCDRQRLSKQGLYLVDLLYGHSSTASGRPAPLLVDACCSDLFHVFSYLFSAAVPVGANSENKSAWGLAWRGKIG